MKQFFVFAFAALVLLLTATPVFAQDSGGTDATSWVIITAGFAMALASSVCALAQGRAIAAACEGIARNPGVAGPIRITLIIGLALIESLAIYVLLIVFLKVSL